MSPESLFTIADLMACVGALFVSVMLALLGGLAISLLTKLSTAAGGQGGDSTSV